MSRTNRLLSLMQIFHENRYPVNAEILAKKLDVSIRTIYRDIETLRQQGVNIAGEAGIGYVLKDSFLLPPMMFTAQEIEALILGSYWVNTFADEALATSAKDAIAKIKNVIPKAYQCHIEENTLFVPNSSTPTELQSKNQQFATHLRTAIRLQHECKIAYCDEKNETTERLIYPFGIAFFGHKQVVMAWCCLRDSFRHFRMDRIMAVTILDKCYSPNKSELLKKWYQTLNIKPLK